jgi:hypothetical protein
MESVYYIVAIRVNETSWACVWRLCSRYLGTGYDNLLGVAPDSRTRSPQELIWESNFSITPNVDPFSLLIQESMIRFILHSIIFLYCK